MSFISNLTTKPVLQGETCLKRLKKANIYSKERFFEAVKLFSLSYDQQSG